MITVHSVAAEHYEKQWRNGHLVEVLFKRGCEPSVKAFIRQRALTGKLSTSTLPHNELTSEPETKS